MDQQCRDYYLANGYCLFEGAVPTHKIDSLLAELEAFKTSGKVFYSQSEHNWRSSARDLDDHGLLNCSFENFT